MRLAVAHLAVGAVVAGGHEHGHTQRFRFLEDFADRFDRFLRPRDPREGLELAPVPADRQHRRVVGRVVDGRADHFHPALIGPRGEVHGDRRALGDRSRHVDVEHDLPVRFEAAGDVFRFEHAHVVQRGLFQFEFFEEFFDVLRFVAGVFAAFRSAELDQPDRLILRFDRGKVVELGHFRRGRFGDAPSTHRAPRHAPVIQAEHPLHDLRELGREVDVPLATAVGLGRRLVAAQLHPEHLLHLLGRARDLEDAPGGAALADAQAVRFGEAFERFEVLRRGAIELGEALAREVARTFGGCQPRGVLERRRVGASPHAQGDRHLLVRVGRPDSARARRRATLGALQTLLRIAGIHRSSPLAAGRLTRFSRSSCISQRRTP